MFVSILGAIVATCMLALNPSPMIANAGAQMYGDQYGYDTNYYQDDNRYGYDNNHQKKSSHGDIQKINCVNSIININGIDISQIPQDDTAVAAANEGGAEGIADAANTQNSNGLADKINFDRNLVNVCVNNNDNEQTRVIPPPTDGNEPPASACATCFTDNMTPDQIKAMIPLVDDYFPVNPVTTLEEFCQILEDIPNDIDEGNAFLDLMQDPAVDLPLIPLDNLRQCLGDLGVIEGPG